MKTYSLLLSVLVFSSLTTPVFATIRYVNATSATPVAPYLSPANAAVTIQDALDVAVPGDQILVADGIYQTGGRVYYGAVTNRVVVDKAVTVQSVNGPAATIIQGYQLPGVTNGDAAVRCVFLKSGATISGFTLSHGATLVVGDLVTNQSGGGVWCESTSAVLTNCVLSGNASDSFGGGAFSGTLNNCTISGNTTASQGGGVYQSLVNNCTVSGNTTPFLGGGAYGCILNNSVISSNSASSGGGIYSCTAVNCLVYSNSATVYGGGSSFSDLENCTVVKNSAVTSGGGVYKGNLNNCIVWFNAAPDTNASGAFLTASHCCITPLMSGAGNFNSSPQFVSLATGNFQLSPTSPCINAGENAFAPSRPDLGGNPRISGGTVDVGAYEFQNPSSLISYAWLQQYGLPTTGAADFIDSDLDGLNNWQEWMAGTSPIDPSSVLKMSSSPAKNSSGATITWQSVSGKTYYIQRSSNLGAQPPFSALQSNIVGQAGTTSYTDTGATGPGPFFYRVGVQ
jgi:hypothetical protein